MGFPGILEQVAVPSFRGSSRPRDGTCVSCIGRQIQATRKVQDVQLTPDLGLLLPYHAVLSGRILSAKQVGLSCEELSDK